MFGPRKLHLPDKGTMSDTTPKNGEIALQTPRSDLLPCHFYFNGTKCKAKDITGTYESVYHIKMVNGFKKVLCESLT